MRFLQTEWHRHERDRNAWEIEREEMKKRIAGLEGESRSSKGLHGMLERQIRMLEMALKKERENVNRLKKGEALDLSKDSKESAREELKELKAAGKCITTSAPHRKSLTSSSKSPEGHQPVRQRDRCRPSCTRYTTRKRAGQVKRLPEQMLFRSHVSCHTDQPRTS